VFSGKLKIDYPDASPQYNGKTLMFLSILKIILTYSSLCVVLKSEFCPKLEQLKRSLLRRKEYGNCRMTSPSKLQHMPSLD
jgi:hypothetical protein